MTSKAFDNLLKAGASKELAEKVKGMLDAMPYDDSLPYGGEYGVWKKGDKFDWYGTVWEVVKLRDKGRTILAKRQIRERDAIGRVRDSEDLKEFPLSGMKGARRV